MQSDDSIDDDAERRKEHFRRSNPWWSQVLNGIPLARRLLPARYRQVETWGSFSYDPERRDPKAR